MDSTVGEFDDDVPWDPQPIRFDPSAFRVNHDYYNSLTKIYFDDIDNKTVISYIPPNVRTIKIRNSPGIICKPHPSQENITKFQYTSWNYDETLAFISKSNFSGFTRIQHFNTNITPIIPFPTTPVRTLLYKVILEDDIITKEKQLTVIKSYFTDTTSINVLKLNAIKCFFDDDILPIMPNIIKLQLINCGSQIQLANEPTHLLDVECRPMSQVLKSQLERLQLKYLHGIPRDEIMNGTYSTQGHLIRVNGDPLFFKEMLNKFKTDMTHYTLTRQHFTQDRPLSEIPPGALTRKRSRIVREEQELRNSAKTRVMKNNDIHSLIQGYITGGGGKNYNVTRRIHNRNCNRNRNRNPDCNRNHNPNPIISNQ
jgi:hypothetical protein